ncbi:MAG: transposase, partial [Verrucomicrobium sp.]
MKGSSTDQSSAVLFAADFFMPLDFEKSVTVRRRHLPHWRQDGATYFVTFRLADSLPAHIRVQWKDELEAWFRHHPEPWNGKTVNEYRARFLDGREEWFDRGFGECLLTDTENRKMVVGALQYFHGSRYLLDAFVVMPNHVHALLKPLPGFELSDILQSWKRHSSREIHRSMGKEGALWMDESHDRIVRDESELFRYRNYILKNPQEANLREGEFSLEIRNVMKTRTVDASATNGEPVTTGCNPVTQTGCKPVLPPFPLCEIQDHDDW